jgi:hypothetical protein
MVKLNRTPHYSRPWRCEVCGRTFLSNKLALEHENGCKLHQLLNVGESPEKEGEKPWPRYPLFDSSKPPEKEGFHYYGATNTPAGNDPDPDKPKPV